MLENGLEPPSTNDVMSIPRTTTPYWHRHLQTSLTLMAWYGMSSSIILLTKWLFNNFFKFPLIVTTYSNTIASLLAWLTSQCVISRDSSNPMSRSIFLQYVLPLGFLNALEIGCSNEALKLLTVSFGTILKGGGPIFTWIWGVILGVEDVSLGVCLALVTMAVGIGLASAGEEGDFPWAGFSLQLLATCLGGLRWALTHKFLHHVSVTPLTATLYTSPTVALFVLPFAVILEGETMMSAETSGNELLILATMTLVAILVFLLLVSEYWIVHATSSLALSVAAVFKELLTILGGVVLLSEHVDTLNIMGFIICQIGILGYLSVRLDRETSTDYEQANQVELSPIDYATTDKMRSIT
jgi:solute carrier family 35, member C2